MGKYEVKYHSQSKGEDLEIESMPTPHLMNAWRKLEGSKDQRAVREAIELELDDRDYEYDVESGRWEYDGPGGLPS